jgi:hypothetical protein
MTTGGSASDVWMELDPLEDIPQISLRAPKADLPSPARCCFASRVRMTSVNKSRSRMRGNSHVRF